MGKGKGSGKTPENLKILLTKAVEAESQYAVARKTGLALSAVQRFLKGDREPSTATLQKLSAFLKVPVHELRGEAGPWDEVLKGLSDEARELLLVLAEKLAEDGQNGKYITSLRQLVNRNHAEGADYQ